MLQALQKIPHGWLPEKAALGLMIARLLLMLSLLPITLIAAERHQPTPDQLIDAVLALYFAISAVVLIGAGERITWGKLIELTFYVLVLCSFFDANVRTMQVAIAALVLLVLSSIVDTIESRW